MPWKTEGFRLGMYDIGIVTVTWEPPVTKRKTKTPVCEKCGLVMKGRVPLDATGIICFFCANPTEREGDEDRKLTNWKDKRD